MSSENQQLIKCPNCGAMIDSHADKCPYCGHINAEGAEEKYMSKLENIREDLSDVSGEVPKTYKKGIKGGVRVVLISSLILLILVILGTFYIRKELAKEPDLDPTGKKAITDVAYRAELAEKLDEAYEQKDIAELARLYEKADEEDLVNIYGMEHYKSAFTAGQYVKMQDALAKLDEGKSDHYSNEQITYTAFYIYYKCYGEENADLFDDIRKQEIIPLLTGRLGYTIEDMESFRDELVDTEINSLDRSKMHRMTKKYYKNYH